MQLEIESLGDLGFLPVILPNAYRTVHGWVLVNQNPDDPDRQIVFIDHSGSITTAVIET